ncbi:MAG: cysteine synthase family protein [Armatimonadetes bacterium]|nr:cysteine synthase family protein [Armatimonadota bacterium]
MNARSQTVLGTELPALIGKTPLVPIRSWNRQHPERPIYAKAEWMNPGGSVKDRPALQIVKTALEGNELGRGRVLLDATSGNTGIAYAMLGAWYGFPVELAVPANCSPERKKLLKAYGAVVHYTDPLSGSDGAILKVRELRASHPDRYFVADQYGNDENWKAHYLTTAEEIWRQTRGEVTHFVAGIGTSGTLMGTGRRLRELNPEVAIVAVEPAHALHGLEGLKHMDSSILPPIYRRDFADRKLSADTEDAYTATRRLAQEGYAVGMSSGAALVAALEVATGIEHGVVVTIFPDSLERYLESALMDPW